MNRYDYKPFMKESVENKRIELQQYLLSQNVTPFGNADSSVGMEFELQVAVEGEPENIDLPITLYNSDCYQSILKRTECGDLPPCKIQSLDDYLYGNTSKVWENSWVRFGINRLTDFSRKILRRDLQSDKTLAESPERSDVDRFLFNENGEEKLRVPVSYLLKLSLANCLSASPLIPDELVELGLELMDHLTSDNTSPEILSFSVQTADSENRVGAVAAQEACRTFLFCQLLVQYANLNLGLVENGQKCLLYSAPHAPQRQKQLNEVLPEGFYRHLFVSPCLSGWDRGEDKHQYMELCHRTLSKSQLNTISKLKDSGIITNNLVVLPNTSTTCLANNGTHVSIGSRVLTSLAQDDPGLYSPLVEKYMGDLIIKIVEHFLPLFVNTYSASPYRLDCGDFHPEKVLGFLPHELDYTHLRMLWRRWKKKAKLSCFGKTLTPFGPKWLDDKLALLPGLKGDLAPDFRLIDFFVTLMSTQTNPALDGTPGNHEELKRELTERGIFDHRMSMYLLFRQRLSTVNGYCGYEGRLYSLFQNLTEDMAGAVDLQNLITALASRYVLDGVVTHNDIPDTPFIESERRQVFFATAAGVPTVYIKENTTNTLMHKILGHAEKKRHSRRYKGFIRVPVTSYKSALYQILVQDGSDLIEQLNMQSQMTELKRRLSGESPTAFQKLVDGIKQETLNTNDPFSHKASDFNLATEQYYRSDLKKKYLQEALAVFAADYKTLSDNEKSEAQKQLRCAGVTISPEEFYLSSRKSIVDETASEETVLLMLRLALIIIKNKRKLK